MPRYKFVAGVATLALGLLGLQPAANAAVVQVVENQQFSATPINVSLGTGTFSFTLDNSGFFPMSSIASSGSGQVSTLFGVTDFGAGAPIDGTGLFGFAPYATPTSIPYSAAVDFVGLSYKDTVGTHYAFAEVFGATFVGYAYETAANTTIFTQQVPEPASAALLIGGLAMVGLARRKKQANRSEVAA